jgi:hypothetical protein
LAVRIRASKDPTSGDSNGWPHPSSSADPTRRRRRQEGISGVGVAWHGIFKVERLARGQCAGEPAFASFRKMGGQELCLCGPGQRDRVAVGQIRINDASLRRSGMNREEYVERMKHQIDEWNTKLDKWEAEVQKAQANVKTKYEAQIQALEKQRDEAVKRLNETRDASQNAWMEVSKGAESAWKTMQASFEKAWSEFQKKK